MSASHGPLARNDHRYQQTLANVEAAADAVEHGRIVTEQQLSELREATNRLRHGIEIYAASASVRCPQCGGLYVPVVSTAPCCFDTGQEIEETRSRRPLVGVEGRH
jgi:hypothetical protein